MPLTQGYHQQAITYGVQLHRFYCGSSPDEVGSVGLWDDVIRQMFVPIPFSAFWAGLDLRIWDMDSPQMELEVQQGISCLQDGEPAKPGYQTWAGAYWDKHRLDIGVFPANWRGEDPALDRTVTAADVTRALMVLAHEAGHHHERECIGSQDTAIRRELWRVFGQLAAAANLMSQAQNLAELWAELFRAYFGPTGARGAFSDGRAWTPSSNPKLYVFMKTAYWLQAYLGSRDWSTLTVLDTCVWWEEWKLVQKPDGSWERQKAGIYCIDLNFQKWRWDGYSTWIRA